MVSFCRYSGILAVRKLDPASIGVLQRVQ
jgi:hypothetical protein